MGSIQHKAIRHGAQSEPVFQNIVDYPELHHAPIDSKPGIVVRWAHENWSTQWKQMCDDGTAHTVRLSMGVSCIYT
jgi:hypothetical protein